MDRATAPPHTDEEIYELLRRYQGYVEPTFSDAKLRMPLYGIFEKYNRILRELRDDTTVTVLVVRVGGRGQVYRS